jgi:demethoxyubiquinone hydroxylase (CLK1/Coq7/Cat5 family)
MNSWLTFRKVPKYPPILLPYTVGRGVCFHSTELALACNVATIGDVTHHFAEGLAAFKSPSHSSPVFLRSVRKSEIAY